MTKKTFGIVIGCRTLSILLDPDPDVEADDLLGEEAKRPDDIVCQVKEGDKLEVDTSKVVFDRWGDRYYKVWTETGAEGYVPIGAVSFKHERSKA